MAVKIRLTRLGKVSKPVYRVIAIDENKKRNGRAIEVLGTYDPKFDPAKVVLNNERVKYWLSVGAKPTETVANLLAKNL